MSRLRCHDCQQPLPDSTYFCACGGTAEVTWSPPLADAAILRSRFDRRLSEILTGGSGVWRYHELIAPAIDEGDIVSIGEGNTPLAVHPSLTRQLGVARLAFKHEGMNPTASFKDRGMTVGLSKAVADGARAVVCASTGNTSASLAAYASAAGLPALVLIPAGKIAYGKLAQAVGYGAHILQIDGNFDGAMGLVERLSGPLGLTLLNYVNPWRIEGQKAIGIELLHQRRWQVPDWIVLPAGNLGNSSALGKALRELHEIKLIDRLPRVAAIQAAGSAPFFRMMQAADGKLVPEDTPETIATAIRIGNPRSAAKAARVIRETGGVVRAVSDAAILEAKARIDRAGIGCEPASAASFAGALALRAEGLIGADDDVVCILTGHLLKDPDATVGYHTGKLETVEGARINRPRQVSSDDDAVRSAIEDCLAL